MAPIAATMHSASVRESPGVFSGDWRHPALHGRPTRARTSGSFSATRWDGYQWARAGDDASIVDHHGYPSFRMDVSVLEMGIWQVPFAIACRSARVFQEALKPMQQASCALRASHPFALCGFDRRVRDPLPCVLSSDPGGPDLPAYCARTKGFDFFSRPMLVWGPCPGTTTVASGSVYRCRWMDSTSWSASPPGRSVRPTDP